MRKIIRVIDLETGPEPTDENPGIIEYGHVDVASTSLDMLGNPYDWFVTQHGHQSILVNPGAPIPPESSAIHNIIDVDVGGQPAWNEVKSVVASLYAPEDEIVAYCAHNIKTESKLIGTDLTGDLPWLCTYKIALHLWPHFPFFSNAAIRYALNPDGLDRHYAMPVHRAMPDAYVTAFTLREALNAGHSVETLAKWTVEPALTPRCKIGKDYNNNGKGTPWKDVESSMLQWILDRDFDEDIMYTARFHLEQRAIDQRIEFENSQLRKQLVANGFDPETDDKPTEPARDTKTLDMDL